jgi:hypothetical protein
MSNGEHRAKLGRQGPVREIGALHPRCHLVQLCAWNNGVDGAHSIANNVEVAQYPPLWIADQTFQKSADGLCTD